MAWHRRALLAATAMLGGCSPLSALDATVSRRGVVVEEGLAYGEGPRRRLDLYRPAAGPPGPLVVFVYGGAWQEGERGAYGFVGAMLARRGCTVAIPDYRLFPEARFPGFVEDAAAATAWVAARVGGRRVVLAGHSAGAHIALLLALDPRYLARAGWDRDRLAGCAALAAPTDFLPIDRPDIIPIFAGLADPRESQPIAFADGRAPPLLLLHGAEDRTVGPRNSRVLAEAVRAAGGRAELVIYPGLGHAGILLALSPLFAGRAPVLDDLLRFAAVAA